MALDPRQPNPAQALPPLHRDVVSCSVNGALLVAPVRSWLADYDSASEVVRVQLLTTGAQFNTAEQKHAVSHFMSSDPDVEEEVKPILEVIKALPLHHIY
ncbi:MAG: hypothetical protein ASARMPRED_003001 [Alectoria sarmentosa]|nr:MAG: hypothetical protein ASARMPRED_003001 [Alectoria sarmentosa]